MTAAPAETDLRQEVKNVIQDEFGHVLSDLSWRIHQAYDLLDSVEKKTGDAGVGGRQIYAEDLNLSMPVLTGYTVTNSSPIAGSIAWADLHIVYEGIDYTITNANTALKYAYWQKGTTPTVLQVSNTKPTLGKDDVLVFVNNGGIAAVAMNSSMPVAIRDSTVDAGAILANAVTAGAIADGALNRSAILAANVVGSAAIADGAVGRAAQLTANVVGAAALADGAVVRAGQLAANVVAAGKIADGALNRPGILAANVVSAGSIADGALNRAGILVANVVGAGAIADGAVVRPGQMAADVVTSTQIADSAVVTAAIADGAVSGLKVAAGAVTPIKMNTVMHMFY